MEDFNESMKWISISVIAVITFAVVGFVIYQQLAPKYAEVDRKVFEESKSYVHGKIQDLGKLYEEYQADKKKRPVIKNLIQVQFSDFDAGNIENLTLRNFLTEMRGY